MRPVAVCLTLSDFWSSFLAIGCGSDDKRADLVILNGAEPESIDPAVVTGQLEGRICYALFEGLLHFDRFGKPQPGIAESWDLSSDGKTYTFHLRANAKWSNGDPVTANDFVQILETDLVAGNRFRVRLLALPHQKRATI